MNEPSLQGKTALITGAAKRIGREIALGLAREGVNIVVHYNQSEVAAHNLCDEVASLGVKTWAVRANFSEKAEYEALMDRAFQAAGQVDILVNNASIFPTDDLRTMSFESLVGNMQINAWAPFLLCQKLSEKVTEGKVVNLLDSRLASYDWAHVGYILSKHVLSVLTQMTALALAPRITVNGVAPGLILPPPGHSEAYIQERAHTVPLLRHGEPLDIAQAVIYLLKANFVTGTVIFVDGGRHLAEYGDG